MVRRHGALENEREGVSGYGWQEEVEEKVGSMAM